MNPLDFTDPGVMEYMLVLILAGLTFLVLFIIWFASHTHSERVNNIVDKIRARGPVATISIQADGRVTVKQHKTPDDIRQDIADEYAVRLNQVTHRGGGKYTITPDPVLTV